MTRYYKDFCGATASIKEHKDGKATLTICVAGKRTRKKYASFKSAYNAWYRFCN